MSETTRLTRADIHRLFELLDADIGAEGVDGEIYLVGGAVMCLALDARPSMGDLDDVRYLLRYLNIVTVDEALAIVTRYFSEQQLPPKSRLALEELLVR